MISWITISNFQILEVTDMIYQAIDESIELSYYELALKHGFDLKRLYK